MLILIYFLAHSGSRNAKKQKMQREAAYLGSNLFSKWYTKSVLLNTAQIDDAVSILNFVGFLLITAKTNFNLWFRTTL